MIENEAPDEIAESRREASPAGSPESGPSSWTACATALNIVS
jgi:hypothetical protein